MKFPVRRRPSASMAVALTALVVALSGTAVAATGLVTGDNLIKPRSLSGNRLRNHSVTGQQVAAGTLAKVPSAKKADRAFVAGSSENAVNAQDAQSATNARNASTLGGQPPSSFLPSLDRVGTNGVMKEAAGSGPVMLFSFGPFTVTMACAKSGSTTTETVTPTSGEAGSIMNVPFLLSSVSSATSLSKSAAAIDFESPRGSEAIFSAAEGVNGLGTDCWANWVGIR